MLKYAAKGAKKQNMEDQSPNATIKLGKANLIFC